jgi:cysteine-rich repeat protein
MFERLDGIWVRASALVCTIVLSGCGGGESSDTGFTGPTGSPTTVAMTEPNTSGGTTGAPTTGAPVTTSSGSGESSGGPLTAGTTEDPSSSSSSSTGEPCPLGSEGCPCNIDVCDGELVCEADVCVVYEECDDANQNNLDACTNQCKLAACGDGYKQPGEQCDDGNQSNFDFCTNQCKLAACGDGFKGPGEECDDGNQSNSDLCTNQCKLPVCGDGFQQPGEQCDDGNQVNTDGCTSLCKLPICGDGYKQAGEQCDDGNQVNTDFCTNACKLPVCGDGFKQPGEECDDGNQNAGDGCTAMCLNECGNDCWGNAGCKTNGGKCIRFTCTPGNSSKTACDTCFGWKQVTYDQWMNQGYCADVTTKYRSIHNNETRCGAAPVCCSTPGACGGGDNAWHFHDGNNNRYVGPCLGCNNDMNCQFWNGTDDGTYTRITACERK